MELYYEDLTPEAQHAAMEFLKKKFSEVFFNDSLHFIEEFMRRRGITTDRVMFDATDPARVTVHVTGKFFMIPPHVTYAAAGLGDHTFYIGASNSVFIAAITPDEARRESALAARRAMCGHFANILREAEIKMSARVWGVVNEAGGYKEALAQFIEDSGYIFDANGVCLEE